MEEVDVAGAWFQQDGATAHTAQRSIQALREMFPGKLISLAAMSGGQRIRLISLPAISSCGAISNQRCTHTDVKTFKPSRTLFAGKSPLFHLQ